MHGICCISTPILQARLIMATRYEVDSYMIDFEPYRSGTNPNHDYDSQTLNFLKGGTVYDQRRRDDFCDRINEWLSNYLRSVIKEVGGASSIVLLTVPGHQQDSQPKEFMLDTIRDVLGKPEFVKVKSGHLRRTKTVQKSTDGGIRTESTHFNSIIVDDSEFVENKTVIIIDDVWTSGSTLRACASLVENAGASGTKMIAVGKTVPEPEEF